VKRIYGLYTHSSACRTNTWNRDVNAAINMIQIVNSLIDFGEIPWEFRKDVELNHRVEYYSRQYTYEAKSTNTHGQITKFKRKKGKTIWTQ
jgi:hypothetical protein